MNIRICIGREENAEYFQKQIGDIVEVDFEEYVAAVVASEIGNSPLEACKAQAIAARTYVMQKVRKGKEVSDLSSVAQAYRAKRNDAKTYPNALRGTDETEGIIIMYQDQPINAVYSANNGGRTVSSKERWGGSDRPYLIAQDDPWDAAVGGKRTGHGVGMSQHGAVYAAKNGYTAAEILNFYYPNTNLYANYGVKTMIQTKDLIALFQKALNEKWGYIWGTSGETWTKAKQEAATREMTIKYGSKWIGKRVSDCSGLFYWAFKQLGGYMYHGSNTMYKQYCTDHGKLIDGKKENGEELKPGTAVFMWNSTNNWHHVGLYIGDGKVIEAKGTYYGVVSSNVENWHYWGELKDVDYDGTHQPVVLCHGKVNGGTLNLRNGPSKSEARILGIPSGTTVEVIEFTNDEWWKVIYNGRKGYVMKRYLDVVEKDTDQKDETEPVTEPVLEPVLEPDTDVTDEPADEMVSMKREEVQRIYDLLGDALAK